MRLDLPERAEKTQDEAKKDCPLLFRPITLRGITARNRIVVSPMCQYLSIDGGPTDWHLVHLGRFAMGGAGIIFSEDSVVEARGRTTHRCAGLYEDRLIPEYRRINDFLKALGAVPAVQIGHTGRVASTRGPLEGFGPLNEEDARRGHAGWRPVEVSPGASRADGVTPLELDRNEIGHIIEAYAAAAVRAHKAGYDILEIHGGHGYLVHQFLSEGSNRRTDDYGGSLLGRMRFALEVVEAVRAVWPDDKPLFFRVSAVEGKGGTWGMRDTLTLGRELIGRGVDVIDCSSGGIGGPSGLPAVPRVPGFQAGYAKRVRGELGCRTMAVGGISSGPQAERILQDGAADLIAIATEFMVEPNWPVRAARELGMEDYLDLLPVHHAFRTKRRDRHLEEASRQEQLMIPYEVDESVPYTWE
ncbi:oxidoreductase [Ancylobacter mangrovi]|uniref:oxidoreductase n=1 Tax=Ancylobacter mangrovi TaxID=2972472 RepID=UPI0021619BE8|nr:NADH:flavin oxidoreductase/NADH oxidase [Ancylobacter mangrovi]MCS0504884.1 NADH:flavin oxidoreductase/NADH oxidase [Ancylobacter mangrovi]